MRAGALPLLAWGSLLIVLLTINWIWTGDALAVGQFGLAALVVLGSGAGLAFASRQALRRGPPEAPAGGDIEAVAQASVGAVLAGLAVGSIVLGFAFGKFLVYFGAGLLVLSLGRVAVEIRAQRISRERYLEDDRR